MRANREITEEEFTRKKTELTKEKIRLEEFLRDTGDRVDKWLDMADNVFHFARDAKKKFEMGTLEDRRQILACLGSNLLLKDKILTINLRELLTFVKEIAQEVTLRLEPADYRRETTPNYDQSLIWWRRGGSNP